MCLLRMDLAGILQNPPNLDSPRCASPALGLFLCGKENPPIRAGSYSARRECCAPAFLGVAECQCFKASRTLAYLENIT